MTKRSVRLKRRKETTSAMAATRMTGRPVCCEPQRSAARMAGPMDGAHTSILWGSIGGKPIRNRSELDLMAGAAAKFRRILKAAIAMRRAPLAFWLATMAACGGGATAASLDDGGLEGADGGGLEAGVETGGDGAGPVEGGVDGGPTGPSGCAMLVVDGGAASKWAYVDTPGHLAYGTLPKGERLLDFSTAGYMGGGVALPVVPVAQTVKPSGGTDDTAAIQAAIDTVSKMPLTGGVRGAVLLAPGTFQLAGSLTIAASGVVLRGSGSGSNGTVLEVGGTPRMVVSIAGTGSWTETGTAADITDDYVPSGASTVHVSSTAGLTPGTPVLVDRTITAAWIQFMGMAGMVRNGTAETWIAAGSVDHFDRTVTAVSGSAVTLDAPIPDTFDVSTWGAGAPRATVRPYTFTGRIEQVGLESVHLVAPKQTVPINQPIFGVLEMSAVENAWVSDVASDEFTTGIVVDGTAKWVTIADSSVARTAPIDADAGYPFQYSVDGQQVLVMRCTSSGDDVFSYATQDRANGPNVVLDMTAAGTHTNLQPHQRWATGLLVDGVSTPTGGIALMNRGWDGSGHGWAIGFGVVWNSAADNLLIEQPPGTENWSIGASGTQTTSGAPGGDGGLMPQGIIDSQGTAVAPQSLYLAQLCQRLGPQALGAIGF